MATQAEVAAMLSQTRFLITREPTQIVLNREDEVDDGAGGTVSGEPYALAAQTVFLSAVKESPSMVLVAEGERVPQQWVIIGMPGLDISQDDWFFHDGQTYKVQFVHPDQGWQRKAEAEVWSNGG